MLLHLKKQTLPYPGNYGTYTDVNAQMAELVDALVSGTSGRKTLEVRVFFWAPHNQTPTPLPWPLPETAPPPANTL